MQKFTRPLTREIELAGERLALTFGAEGVQVRPVGSRKPPLHLSWASFLVAAASRANQPEPAPEQVSAAFQAVRSVKAAKTEEAATAASAESATASATEGRAAPAESKEGESSGKADEEGGPTPPLPELLGRLEIWLSQHRKRFHKGLLPGATPEQLDALAKALPCPLPDELRTLLAWHNGQDPEVVGGLEHSWILMGTEDIRRTKHDLDTELPPGWRKEWVPFFDNDADSFMCLDTSQPGHPVRECWCGHSEHPVTAPSLAAWFADFVQAVEAGEYYEDPERGRFLRET